MHRWTAKRHVMVHVGGADLPIPKGAVVVRETDSPMQDRAHFTIEATGQECQMDSDYFTLNFARVP